ncbi:hypothetical protein ACJMK2_039822 [Sinanodonta woodiana]|uniref:Uncharacterized protein n=1 Tax=Sinanodonta woodiana TaxID=1069815 RepID=A0ABD3WD52_SINWO
MVAKDFEATSFLMSLANGNNSAVEDLEATSVMVSLENGNSSAVEDVETTPFLMYQANGNSSAADIGTECILQEGFDSLPGKHTWSSTWNNDLENIFGITPVERGRKVKSKALTCHMLLTSDDIIKEKRNVEILKSTKEAEKEERKRKAL